MKIKCLLLSFLFFGSIFQHRTLNAKKIDITFKNQTKQEKVVKRSKQVLASLKNLGSAVSEMLNDLEKNECSEPLLLATYLFPKVAEKHHWSSKTKKAIKYGGSITLAFLTLLKVAALYERWGKLKTSEKIYKAVLGGLYGLAFVYNTKTRR